MRYVNTNRRRYNRRRIRKRCRCRDIIPRSQHTIRTGAGRGQIQGGIAGTGFDHPAGHNLAVYHSIKIAFPAVGHRYKGIGVSNAIIARVGTPLLDGKIE